MEFSFNSASSSIPTFFAKVVGPKGYREVRAILSTGSKFCMLGYKDVQEIGCYAPYPGVFNKHPGLLPNGVWFTTCGSANQASLTELDEITVGELSARKIPTLIYNPPQESGIDLVLGESFLKNFVVQIDYSKKKIRLDPVIAPGNPIQVIQKEQI